MKIAIIMAVLACTLLMLSSLPPEPDQDAAYCEMVAIWQNDPRPEIDRAGWPPYNSNIKCEE